MKNPKTFTVVVAGDYASSGKDFTGTRKQVLEWLRNEARKMRRSSRKRRGLEDNVFAIDENLHQSKLVTMASFKLNTLGVEMLIELMNKHGVLKYKLIENE